MTYADILGIPPFSLKRAGKEKLFTEKLAELTGYHYDRCWQYRNILDGLGFDKRECVSYYDMPFLPVSIFKELDLLSVEKEDVFKTMTSSGTSGQAVSKIYLDKQTAADQQKTLVKIVPAFTGASRMPMIIIDSPSVVKDRKMFSARGAGILGFSIFGTDRIYALDDDMNPDMDAIERFDEKHQGKRILLFGFTFMVWQHFYRKLAESGRKLKLTDAVLIHGGGWKKLIGESVSKGEFKKRLKEAANIDHVHDYYGMVEQTGCIYMECEHGHLHASAYSDVIMRRHSDFSVCGAGEPGIIQVVSLLPRSYPGHSLLTEDEGVMLGVDDCPCGRYGKYFSILGRLKNAEIRGCSDTYAAGF